MKELEKGGKVRDRGAMSAGASLWAAYLYSGPAGKKVTLSIAIELAARQVGTKQLVSLGIKPYASQSDDACARIWRKQAKAEAKLGPYWERPNGMHGTSREQLLSIIRDCEERREMALGACIAALMRRHPGVLDDPAR